MDDMTDKMKKIAIHLDDLNDQGHVKKNSSNEKGYAKAYEIIRGSALWVHHLLDDELVIDLMISPTAKKNQPVLCGQAKQMFQDYFGDEVSYELWEHSDGTRVSDRYSFRVTEFDTAKIIAKVEELKQRLSSV